SQSNRSSAEDERNETDNKSLNCCPGGSRIVFGDKFETAQTRKDINKGLLDEKIIKSYSDNLGDLGFSLLVAPFFELGVSKLLGWSGRILNIGRKQSPTVYSIYDKLDRYLLNDQHPVGSTKAKWFKEALGFTKDNIDDLAKQIVYDAKKAVQTQTTQYGTMFNQTIKITGANGKSINVVFAWIRNNDGVIRLVTAVPTKL
ncbi:MAG TPA: hypothetical protein PKD85_10970, partial [Saprospiraceae bacterium]|nr:hypothetical protein [Saprospiraceae bacterium]